MKVKEGTPEVLRRECECRHMCCQEMTYLSGEYDPAIRDLCGRASSKDDEFQNERESGGKDRDHNRNKSVHNQVEGKRDEGGTDEERNMIIKWIALRRGCCLMSRADSDMTDVLAIYGCKLDSICLQLVPLL
jgi:hypothetical protein